MQWEAKSNQSNKLYESSVMMERNFVAKSLELHIARRLAAVQTNSLWNRTQCGFQQNFALISTHPAAIDLTKLAITLSAINLWNQVVTLVGAAFLPPTQVPHL